jgi:hypothetical protein
VPPRPREGHDPERAPRDSRSGRGKPRPYRGRISRCGSAKGGATRSRNVVAFGEGLRFFRFADGGLALVRDGGGIAALRSSAIAVRGELQGR